MNTASPVLNLKFLSHGTLFSKDISASKKFYSEFLGLDVAQTSPISLMIKLGGDHIYAVVQMGPPQGDRALLAHNGLDVTTDGEVDEAHKLCVEQADKWGLHKIGKPSTEHGAYGFYFWDADGNSWEILTNPERGYMWIFEQGDQEGRGHLAKDFSRPDSA